MRSFPRLLLCLVSLFVGPSVAVVEAAERSPQEWLARFADQWDDSTWTSGNRRGRYMRPNEDQGWQTRMLVMRGLVSAGEAAIPPLLEALAGDDVPTRILAAQALGYLAPHLSRDDADTLQDRLRAESDPAARLYLVDALGMRGAGKLEELLTSVRSKERNRDALKHMGYALERGTNGVQPDVIQSLLDWSPETMDSAQLGQPAPDFELTTVGGTKVRLSQFRGQQAVVLVFIYGDT